MKLIWNIINKLKIDGSAKVRLFLFLQIMNYGLVGALLWLVLGHFLLRGVQWFICFVGYPAIFAGFVGSVIYLYNHEFE